MAAYFGDPGQTGDSGVSDLLPMFNAIRNRKMQDFKDQQDMAATLPIRQARMMAAFDPKTGMGRTTNPLVSQGLTPANPEVATTLKEDLSPLDKANLQLKKNDQTLEQQKITQQGKIGEERIGIQSAQEKLNQQKNENIHQTKLDELQRKVDDSTAKLGLSYDRLQQNKDNNDAHMQFLKDKADADNARHALELERANKALEDTKALHGKQIEHLNAQIEDLKNPKQVQKTTEVNPEGTKKTETTTKTNPAFKSSTTIKMLGKDGKSYMIDKDKVDSGQAEKDGFTKATQ